MAERVEATITYVKTILHDIHVGSQIGNCAGEVKEVKTGEGELRVDVVPSGLTCSKGPCPLSQHCSKSMEGYL